MAEINKGDLELLKAGDIIVAHFYRKVCKQAALLRRAPPLKRVKKSEDARPSEKIKRDRLARLATIKRRRNHAILLSEGAKAFLKASRIPEDGDAKGYFKCIRHLLSAHHGVETFSLDNYAASVFYEAAEECLEKLVKLETLLHLRYAYPHEVETRARKLTASLQAEEK